MTPVTDLVKGEGGTAGFCVRKCTASGYLLCRIRLVAALDCPRSGCNGRMCIESAVFDPNAVEAICAALIHAGTLAPHTTASVLPPTRTGALRVSLRQQDCTR